VPASTPTCQKSAARSLVNDIRQQRARLSDGFGPLGKLIETQSGGRLVFHLGSPYPLLYRLEEQVALALVP